MKITINNKISAKYNISLGEALVLLFNTLDTSYSECKESLIKKGIVGQNLYDKDSIVLASTGRELINNIIIESDEKSIKKDFELKELAEKMISLYPEGKKPGTKFYWRDSVAVITKRLKSLISRYNCSFTNEEVLFATQKYVELYNEDKTFMKLLKYFIFKIDANGDFTSDLMTLIENKDNLDITKDDFDGELCI